MKHIEQILPEVAAGELDRMLAGDDPTASAALTELLQRVTGCEIPLADTTPESDVEELVPLCLSILRRHWQTPLTALGDGTEKRSLADTFRALIGDRVQGDPLNGIPPANGSIAEAVEAVGKRNIDCEQADDGISLSHLLCNETAWSKITDFIDTNYGWTMDRMLPTFGDINILRLNCIYATCTVVNGINAKYIEFPYLKRLQANGKNLLVNSNVEIAKFPLLQTIATGQSQVVANLPYCKELYFDSLESFDSFYITRFVENCPLLTYVNLQSFKGHESWHGNFLYNCPELRKVIFGVINKFYPREPNNDWLFNGDPKLIHLEIGADSGNGAINFMYWQPTMALRTDTTAEDYVDLREDTRFANNLEQFLWNFQAYIADRVADRTGQTALTLTLSQAVYEALQAQEGQTILATLTNKNWTVAQA